ncbi:hypothetical protein PC121_g23714 [Phytophthora cactorum]|nr:hypothetical protein PC120_g26493 [Phytophthora cactorum]KAG3039472.1 hypothetical protein PC121_g23714 [Phytophthora cactorum]
MQLVRREHPDYEVVMLTASTAETGSLLTYVGRSALNVFGWLNWIIKTVSRSTSARILLQEDTQMWTRFVSKHLEGHRKPHMDCGALHRCRHARAIWAHPRRMEPRLGAFRRRLRLLRSRRRHEDPSTLLGTPAERADEDHSARGYHEFFAGMLYRGYNKQLSDCIFLAVQVDMEQDEDDLAPDDAPTHS